MSTLSDLRDIRIEKLNKLKELGINPYPSKAEKDANNVDVTGNYSSYEGKILNLTGRILSLRQHGSIVFVDIHDQSGKIQLYIKKENIAEKTDIKTQSIGFEDLQLLDIGDFVQAIGNVVKTKSGEISLEVTEVKLLTKSLRPIPDYHEGLKDKETRYRRRYLDLIVNPEVKERFFRKAHFWVTARKFMHDKGFIEVETPVLELVTGGADAAPFVTHHNALDQDFYLRISSELYQKRLIGAGFEKVFVLGPNFRNEGIDDEHLQEYYQLEWYWAYADYRDNMNFVKELYRYLAKEVYGNTKFERKGMSFDLADEWEEIDYTSSIKNNFGIDIFKDSEEKMREVLEDNGILIKGNVGRNRIVDNLWKIIRKDITGPAFLVNIPKFISPLAKSLPENEELTERFQPIIAGSELGNGYSELNDPFDQLERFLEQQNARDAGDEEAQMLDIDFVEMLEYGMPPTSGYGMSERLFWFLEDVTAREGTLFPQMKYKLEESTKSIYGIEDNMTDNNSNNTHTKNSSKANNSSKISSEKQDSDAVNYHLPSREEALNILTEHVKDDYQILHAKMVANIMEKYAEEFGENPDLWYVTGLLHDLDYHEYPEEHPKESIKWFLEWEFPTSLINAIKAHALDEPRFPPDTKMAAALIAIDELTGLLYAYSLMRPTGFIDMKASSVKKKFKDKAFAAKVDREEILYGIEQFGVDFNEHITFLINQLLNIAEFS